MVFKNLAKKMKTPYLSTRGESREEYHPLKKLP